MKPLHHEGGQGLRCTRVEQPGEGVPEVFAKIPRGVQGFQEKLPGGSPYFGFYCIFYCKCFEICLRGVLYLPVPLTPPMIDDLVFNFFIQWKSLNVITFGPSETPNDNKKQLFLFSTVL